MDVMGRDENNTKEDDSLKPDLVDEYLETLERRRTQLGYKQELRGFFNGEATVERVRAVTWGEMSDHLSERAVEYKEATVARRSAVLQSFFRWLVANGKLL